MAHLHSANDSEQHDVTTFSPGDRFSAICGPTMRRNKWRGGLWVMYVDSPEGDYVVEVSDGTASCGFMLFPSENYHIMGLGSNANWTSGQPATGIGGQNVMTVVSGGLRTLFKTYETRRLVAGSRVGAAITYTLAYPGNVLKVSENGLLCNDSNADLATVGVTAPVVVGIVSAVPSERNSNRLGADIKF